jgi:hypothetical protein
VHLVTSLLVAEGFYRLAERPSQRLGRYLGRNWRTLARPRRPVTMPADL